MVDLRNAVGLICCLALMALAAVYHRPDGISDLQRESGAWHTVRNELSTTFGKHDRLPPKISKFAKELSRNHFSSLPVHAHLKFGTHHSMDLTGPVAIPSDSAYASSYPKSYFQASPNAQAKYSWVCPGPSLLEDYHSGACPQSLTGAFRCCVDASNGAAVADDLCCPQREVQLPAKAKLPSKQEIAQRLAQALEDAAIHIEEKQQAERHPYQPRPTSYLASSDSRRDIDSYFDTLSGTPPARRTLPATEARKDLSHFFASLEQGTLGGLEPKIGQTPAEAPAVVVDSSAVEAAAAQLTDKLRAGLKVAASRERARQFSAWKRKSQGPARRRPGVMALRFREEKLQRARADAAWKAAPARGQRVAARAAPAADARAQGSTIEVPEDQMVMG